MRRRELRGGQRRARVGRRGGSGGRRRGRRGGRRRRHFLSLPVLLLGRRRAFSSSLFSQGRRSIRRRCLSCCCRCCMGRSPAAVVPRAGAGRGLFWFCQTFFFVCGGGRGERKRGEIFQGQPKELLRTKKKGRQTTSIITPARGPPQTLTSPIRHLRCFEDIKCTRFEARSRGRLRGQGHESPLASSSFATKKKAPSVFK